MSHLFHYLIFNVPGKNQFVVLIPEVKVIEYMSGWETREIKTHKDLEIWQKGIKLVERIIN